MNSENLSRSFNHAKVFGSLVSCKSKIKQRYHIPGLTPTPSTCHWS